MSFIVENGVMKGYTGAETEIVIPDEVKGICRPSGIFGPGRPLYLDIITQLDV